MEEQDIHQQAGEYARPAAQPPAHLRAAAANRRRSSRRKCLGGAPVARPHRLPTRTDGRRFRL